MTNMSRDEVLTSWEHLQRRMKFEEKVCSTPLGKKTWEMRQRALDLARMGREKEAFYLYEQAAGLHGEADMSPAAAMCWYDLAEVYRRRHDGVCLLNLKQAESLLRRVLRCKGLNDDLHRAAKTRDALASVLRHIAMEPHQDTGKLLAESERLFEEAIRIATQAGPHERLNTAKYVHNLANLKAQQGRLDATILRMDQAEALIRNVPDYLHGEERDNLLSSTLFHAAVRRSELEGGRGRAQAIEQLDEVLSIAHPAWTDRAYLVLSSLLLETPGTRERALSSLRAVRPAELRPEDRRNLIRMYVKANLVGEAVILLDGWVIEAMRARFDSPSDVVANEYALAAQNWAHLLARLHVEQSRPLEAFLVLEYVSGTRLLETMDLYCYKPERPIVRELLRQFRRVSTLAAGLQNTAALVAGVPGPQQSAFLKELAKVTQQSVNTAKAKGFDTGGINHHDAEMKALHAASKRTDPALYLREQAKRQRQKALRMHHRMIALDPKADPRSRPMDAAPTEVDIRNILKEHGGLTLLRLSLTEDLLAIAVGLSGETLWARSHRLPVPPDLFEQLGKARGTCELETLAAVAERLQALDLSPVFPDKPASHVVLLPSFLAALLPLPALGPPGRTLLDHFAAISWLPCLGPLALRQAPCPPRDGTLAVVPVPPGHKTRFHRIATSVELPRERRMDQQQATLAQVWEAVRDADVVSFYTHGKRVGDTGAPELELFDQPLTLGHLDQRWGGVERVELWACESGVNLPSHPLSDWLHQHVDELFGLDFEFLKVGARSAISTLWKVNELVTACLMCRYRRSLLSGAIAPQALIDAQRFWRDEAPALVAGYLRRSPPDLEGMIRALAHVAGARAEEIPKDLFGLPGRLSLEDVSTEQPVEQIIAELCHPLSWAGYRFVGVAERRPFETWSSEYARPLTPEEAKEIERVLGEHEGPGKTFDDWQEDWLSQAIDTVKPGQPPSPEQAIQIARLYRDRVTSSHRHNLLSGLAWLHEALAWLDNIKKGSDRKQARQRLSTEAAHLWIELARNEAVDAFDLAVHKPHAIALARAGAMLQNLGNDPPVRMARAWHRFLSDEKKTPDTWEVALARAWTEAEQALREGSAGTYESIRALTLALELAVLRSKANFKDDMIDHLCQLAQAWLKRKPMQPALAASGERLRSVALLFMSTHVGEDSAHSHELCSDVALLTPREVVREAFFVARGLTDEAASSGASLVSERFNKMIDELEGRVWGFRDDDRTPVWRSTGTLGAAYRKLTGYCLSSRLVALGNAAAAEILTCLHLGTDLRLPLLRRFVHFFVQSEDIEEMNRTHDVGIPASFWVLARNREAMLEQLEAAALLPDTRRVDLERLSSWRPRPHHLDPFQLSSDELEKRGAAESAPVSWAVGETRHWSQPQKETEGARTAAFAVVRETELETQTQLSMWRQWLGAVQNRPRATPVQDIPSLEQIFDPGVWIVGRQDLLRALPLSSVVLALALDSGGRLIVACVWRTGNELAQRAFLTDRPLGMHLCDLLAQLHMPIASDTTIIHGLMPERSETWSKITALLDPILEEVLSPAFKGGKPCLYVLAPGALRPLPLLGLRMRGVALADWAAQVVHLPTLSAEPLSLDDARTDACLLARQREIADTSFGEAAVTTLRRWLEPELITPPEQPIQEIVEETQLGSLAPSLRSLRIYGIGEAIAACPALSVLHLEGKRLWGPRNMRSLFLRRCHEVELWVDTAGAGPVHAILRNDRDQIPGLAREFLRCGAHGVLDIAWPVNDVVKALVCERYGILRRSQLTGPTALCTAVSGMGQVLAALSESAATLSTERAVLDWLDQRRRSFARDMNVPRIVCVPFASCSDAPSISGLASQSLIDAICDPVHLAAFRYWGWL
jgi:CHAT domain-containing protein